MCVTVKTLLAALRSVNPMSLCLVSRHRDKAGSLQLEPVGCLLEMSEGGRIAVARVTQCEAVGAHVACDTEALMHQVRHFSAEQLDCALELLNEVVVLTDKTRVLDYGGICVEQVLRHAERQEIWLMVGCAIGDIAEPLALLAEG